MLEIIKEALKYPYLIITNLVNRVECIEHKGKVYKLVARAPRNMATGYN